MEQSSNIEKLFQAFSLGDYARQTDDLQTKMMFADRALNLLEKYSHTASFLCEAAAISYHMYASFSDVSLFEKHKRIMQHEALEENYLAQSVSFLRTAMGGVAGHKSLVQNLARYRLAFVVEDQVARHGGDWKSYALSEACDLHRRGAEQGYLPAMIEFARMSILGTGTSVNVEKAAEAISKVLGRLDEMDQYDFEDPIAQTERVMDIAAEINEAGGDVRVEPHRPPPARLGRVAIAIVKGQGRGAGQEPSSRAKDSDAPRPVG